jgi:hypothetical protein
VATVAVADVPLLVGFAGGGDDGLVTGEDHKLYPLSILTLRSFEGPGREVCRLVRTTRSVRPACSLPARTDRWSRPRDAQALP